MIAGSVADPGGQGDIMALGGEAGAQAGRHAREWVRSKVGKTRHDAVHELALLICEDYR